MHAAPAGDSTVTADACARVRGISNDIGSLPQQNRLRRRTAGEVHWPPQSGRSGYRA